MKRLELTGQMFGRLTAISPSRTTSGQCGWRCRCSCGNEIIVRTPDLINGHTNSCGCLFKDRVSTHKMSNTPSYDIWVSMWRRCTNPQSKDYPNYGARGITVCQEWLDYPTFYKWMMEQGYKKGLSLDRKNNDEGYSPKNCRLVTMQAQQQNKRNSIITTYNGETKPLIEFSRQFNIPYQTIYYRHRHKRDLMTGGLI